MSPNCSAAVVTVALPDLVQHAVSNLGGPFRRGTAFTVSDTVRNDAQVGTPRSTTTRYYLSTDTARGTGDTLLTGVRTSRSSVPPRDRPDPSPP